MEVRETARVPRFRLVLVTILVALAGIGTGTAMALSAASHQQPARQPAGEYVFACISAKTGQIDYLEFKKPLPHRCLRGDQLWHWAVAPAVATSPTPSPSATPTATATASATPTATPVPYASPWPTVCATPTTSPTPTPTPTVTPTPTDSPSPVPSECSQGWPSPDVSGFLGSAAPLDSPVPSTQP